MPSRHLVPALLLFVLVAGCSSEPSPPPLYPLTGTLTQNGKPVTEGGLIFIPESGDWGGLVVNASVRRGGAFAAETSRDPAKATAGLPGGPAGRYRVAYHPPGDGEKVGTEYHFPEPVTVETKDNALALTLPEQLPGARAGKPDATKPDPKSDE